MELLIQNGDYVPDGAGGMCRLEGAQAVLQSVLFRLQGRRGSFAPLPQMGSQLHKVLRGKPSQRPGLAEQYVREALEEESQVSVSQVNLTQQDDGTALLQVELSWQGETLYVQLPL